MDANTKETTKFRVVKACYEARKAENEFLILSFKELFETQDDAYAAICSDVKDVLEFLNDKKYEADFDSLEAYDDTDRFRADFDSEYDCIIRFWDGDDYRPVRIYTVYEVVEREDPTGKSWRYRDLYVFRNHKHNRFAVMDSEYERYGFLNHSLKAAFDHIDEIKKNTK